MDASGTFDDIHHIQYWLAHWGDGTHITKDQREALATDLMKFHDPADDIDFSFARFDRTGRRKILFKDIKETSREYIYS